jgi:hypothetical protein
MPVTLRRTAAALVCAALTTVAAILPAAPASAAAGDFTLKNLWSRKCLAIGSSSFANGARAIQWTCNGDTDQLWYQDFRNASDDYGQIKNRNSGKCLTVNGASTSTGAQLTQWDCATNRPGEQLWVLDLNNTRDIYSIKNHKSQLVVSIPNLSKTNGTVAVQMAYDTSAYQRWDKVNP